MFSLLFKFVAPLLSGHLDPGHCLMMSRKLSLLVLGAGSYGTGTKSEKVRNTKRFHYFLIDMGSF